MNPMDFQLQVLSQSLTLRLKRHAAIAGNIANADTPGYRPNQVSFEEQLQKAASSGRTASLRDVAEKVVVMDDGVPRIDGNSVNLDKQMGMLSENAIVYNATAEFIARKLKLLKTVIS